MIEKLNQLWEMLSFSYSGDVWFELFKESPAGWFIILSLFVGSLFWWTIPFIKRFLPKLRTKWHDEHIRKEMVGAIFRLFLIFPAFIFLAFLFKFKSVNISLGLLAITIAFISHLFYTLLYAGQKQTPDTVTEQNIVTHRISFRNFLTGTSKVLFFNLIVCASVIIVYWLFAGDDYMTHKRWLEVNRLHDGTPAAYRAYLANKHNKGLHVEEAQAKLFSYPVYSSFKIHSDWGEAKHLYYQDLERCVAAYLYVNNIKDIGISIDIHGKPLSATYKKGFARYQKYTGAKIEGVVTINVVKYPFSFVEIPGRSESFFSGRDDPEDAPFPYLINTKLFPFFESKIKKMTGKASLGKLKCDL